MKAIVSAALTVLCTAVLLSILPLHGEDAVYTEIIRLHVLAHSDCAEDQAVKLSVRDAVLTAVNDIIGDTDNRDTAAGILAENSETIRLAAEKQLTALGRTETATVRFGKEWYPTRVYDDFTLPAGVYTSLRVEIGAASGKNWWCILFPSVCSRFINGGEDADKLAEEFVAAGFTPEEYRLITENKNMPYKVRFWFLEQISKYFSRAK